MKSNLYTKTLRLWAEGLILLVLRWLELKNGFDPATGLSRPNLPGTVLPVLIALLAAVEIFLCCKVPRGKYYYYNTFDPIEGAYLPLLAGGGILLFAGGALMPGWDVMKILATAAGAAAAAGLILFVRIVRSQGELKSLYLLPFMLFATCFVLAVYLPHDSNPVLAGYYPQILAASLLACTSYHLAGFPCREASLRLFLFFGNLSVPLCITCLPGAGSWGHRMIYIGCAVILSVFLTLRRDNAQPERRAAESNPAPAADSPRS